MGIFGDWGSGKTSLMRTVQHKLKKLFLEEDIKNVLFFVKKLQQQQPPLSQFLLEQFSIELQTKIREFNGRDKTLKKDVLNELNRLIEGPCLYDNERFAEIVLSVETHDLLKQIPVLDNYIYLNRLLLEDAYPEAFLFFSNNDIKDVFSFITELSDGNNPISLHLIEKYGNDEFKELLEEIKYVKMEVNNFLSNSIVNMKEINIDDFFATNKKIHKDFEKNIGEKLNEPIPDNDKQVIITHIKRMINNIYIKLENDYEEKKITTRNFDNYFQKLQNDLELPLINDIEKSLKKWNDLYNIGEVKLIDYKPIQIKNEIPGIDIQDSFNDYVNECLDNIKKILNEYVKNSFPEIKETLSTYEDNFWEFAINNYESKKDSLWDRGIQYALYDQITDILLNNIQDLLSTYVQSKLAGKPDSSLLDDHKKIINSVNSLLDSASARINNPHDQELDDNILTLMDIFQKKRDEKVHELLCRYITQGEKSAKDKDWYLFGWDNIPGNDEERFKKYLILNYGVDWVTTEKFERIDDDRTKRVKSGERSLFLKRTNDETKVNLEICGIKTEEFTAKTEQGTLKIYKKCTLNDLINSLQGIVAGELNHVLKSGYLYDKEIFSQLSFETRKMVEQGNIQNLYLFSWDEIPGNDSGKLIGVLKQKFGIDWVKTAEIEKIDNGNTIKLSTEINYLSLNLNQEKTEVIFKIDDGRTDKFIAKMENGKLNIYQNFYRINRFLLEDAYPHEISMNKRNNEGNYTIKTIWFDAWKYDKEEVLWRILLMKILEELKVGPPIENDQASFFRTLARMYHKYHNLFFRLKLLNRKLFLHGLHTEIDQKSLFSKVFHTCRVFLLNPLFTENELKDPRSLISKLCDTNNPLSAFVKERFNSELYLFSWEKVPGNDSEILIEYLTQNFNIEWIKAAIINKNDDDKTIRITNDTNFLSLTLNNEKNNVNLEIDDGRTDEFIVKTKNGERNIYLVYSELNQMLQSYDGISEPSPALIKKLLLEFNRLLIDSKTCFYNEQRFSQVNLTEETKKLINQCPTGRKVIHLNRKLLKEAYGDNNLNKTIEDLQASLYQNIYREELGNIEFKPEKALKGTLKLGISALPTMANINNLIKDMDGKNGLEDLLETLQREKTIKHIKQVQSLEEFEYRFRDIIENYYVKRNKRAVIFIDDLDRCLPEKVIEVLEAIKLFLDAKGCIFILGIDERVVSQAVKLRYKTIPITGENYLEKIIQLTFRLPTKTYENVEDFIEKLDLPDFYEPYRTMIVSGIEPNPRKIKRLISVIELQRKLADSIPEIQSELKESKQKNKRFEALLIEWQIISHYYPEFRKAVEADPEMILRLHNRSATQTDIETIKEYSRLKIMMQHCPIDVSQASHDEIERVISLSNITALEETQEREGKGIISDKNLHGKNLRRTDLSGMNFIRANLTEADLREADLRGAILSAADLSGATLNEANLTGANLTDANLTGANLTDANLTDANLTGANLERIHLSNTVVNWDDFSGYNLTGAILWKTSLNDISLVGAILKDAKLIYTDLIRAKLDNAVLTEVTMKYGKLSSANLKGANLSQAHLTDIVLSNAYFEGADLRGATLKNVSLESAHFDSNTDFENADIDTTTIKSLKGSNWKEAKWSEATRKEIQEKLS